jgi:hypothetical protein
MKKQQWKSVYVPFTQTEVRSSPLHHLSITVYWTSRSSWQRLDVYTNATETRLINITQYRIFYKQSKLGGSSGRMQRLFYVESFLLNALHTVTDEYSKRRFYILMRCMYICMRGLSVVVTFVRWAVFMRISQNFDLGCVWCRCCAWHAGPPPPSNKNDNL